MTTHDGDSNLPQPLPDRLELAGKVAVVTGAGSGIGAATALLLAERGAAVVVADLNPTGAKEVVDAIAAKNGRAIAAEADVSDEAHVRAMADLAVTHFGGVDVLHNNAAFTAARGDRTVIDIDMDLWDQTMAVNVRGYALCAKHLIPLMIERGGGSVINTSSIAGIRGELIRAAYATSKAAIIGFSNSLAVQFGRFGVRSNAIAPGFIATPALLAQMSDEVHESHVGHHPVGRLGRPEDVAELVAFLASDRSAFISAALIPVDGGLTAHTPSYKEDLTRLLARRQPPGDR